MKTTNEIRREVVKIANNLKKQGLSRSSAMKLAWANVRMNYSLREGVVEFFFVKQNGEIRHAFGTLSPAVLGGKTINKVSTPDLNCQKYFDVQKNAWRSFSRRFLLA